MRLKLPALRVLRVCSLLVAKRTNFWDAIGVVSYGMLFAFFESLLLFLFAFLLGILIPAKWGRDKWLAITSLLVFVLALWAMATQLHGLQVWYIPNEIPMLTTNTAHPLRNIYMIAIAFVIPTVILPILTVCRSEKTLAKILDVVDRVSLLTMFYLVLDFVALIIVMIRNI